MYVVVLMAPILPSISLILKFTLVKDSKFHTCVQAKQPRKTHRSMIAINLALLELIHLDICEMIGLLKTCAKKYFFTLIILLGIFMYIS